MTQSLLIDGAPADPSSPLATLSGAREALGESWFESIRVTDGRAELLEEHLQRIAASVATDRELLKSEIAAAVESAGGGDLFVRVVVGERGRVVAAGPLPSHAANPEPARITVADIPDYAFPTKSTDYELQAGLLADAASDGFEDVLITDASLVIEAARANVLMIEGDTLRTPPLGRCLPGVIRAALIDVANSAGLQPQEEPLRINHLLAAGEVLLTNALIRVRTVSEIDGVPVGGRAPQKMARLQDALIQRIEGR